ncbi:O-antigen ligase domain-containing protein [Microcoleus sp. FACHB-672]|uniref:O-antigen ligase domain-containing protein n=1 Tax=Microcoleus sp. FACHB-672 TaxID=2692825 RepID=UPI0016852626|nr:O-antigen ligase domain-containing protein [Microcoleus sp. FACHB-672]MBD2043732.1 O-antigen ligase domain-containing protein [Microcoleus sp. FACHB-672]
MSPTVMLALFGLIPFTIYMFIRYPSQRAVVIVFITAFIFLPVAAFKLPGIPEYSKTSAPCYCILLATFIYDPQRFTSFKFGWLDVPMLCWCFSPFASSITNGLGPYDGFSETLSQTMAWGAPYFLGRIYLNNLEGLRQLALGIFAGGLIYVPLCLFESRMSPQLHRMVYGFAARRDFAQTIRLGGYRPTVFMVHGLWVGVWMMSAALIAVWLWKTGTIKRFWNMPMDWLALALLVTFILCRSTGAYLYFGIGIFILFVVKYCRTALPMYLLIFGLCFYLYLGVSGGFTGGEVVSYVADTLGPERAQSLEFRFINEGPLAEKARERMLFGWGGWGRARIFDEWGEDISVTDSLWIIAFGNQGLFGLSAFVTSVLLPSLSFSWLGYPPSTWSHPKVAPAAALVVILPLFMLDSVLNAMVNQIFMLGAGGLTGLMLSKAQPQNVTSTRSSPARRSTAR